MVRQFFELFDLVCLELTARNEFILADRLPVNLGPELMSATERPVLADALEVTFGALDQHFRNKGSALPFEYVAATGTVTARDQDFISFAVEAANIRSSGKDSKDFEKAIGRKLAARLGTGAFHNIGWPRATRTRLSEINAYLQELGFEDRVLRGRDKDGGMDLLWLLPLGTIPVRPLISFQCKNARFKPATIREANTSVVFATRAIHRHSVMRASGAYMCFVVFNDYLDSEIYDMAEGLQYAPLGLSDLSPLRQGVTLVDL